MSDQYAYDPDQTVSEAGEGGTLQAILANLAPATAALVGPGDDSAVLHTRGDLTVTTDTMIEGPDFRLSWHTGFELGWKLAATNLSDVSAMGARPIALTVALACPSHTPVRLLAEVARGLNAACAYLAPGCGIVGGDLGSAPVLTAAVTAIGDLEGRSPVLRSGAQPGDNLAYAGALGLSGLGLSLLFTEANSQDAAVDQLAVSNLKVKHQAAIAAQLAPSPPINLGIEASEHGATAMLDVSDGLSLDAARIARASGVTITLSEQLLRASFGEQGGEKVTLETMLTGGEDHGFLATFPPNASLPPGFQIIGEILAEQPGIELLVSGKPYVAHGWDPYQTFTTDVSNLRS